MNDKSPRDPILGIQSGILDGIRQFCFPAEFRIADPGVPLDAIEIAETNLQSKPADSPAPVEPDARDGTVTAKLIAEFATCLWYLKTKHFKRDWDDGETGDDDPRVRRALSRLNKCIEALSDCGVEVHDPTNNRYPAGGEGMMRPIQFLPTAGITFEIITETVAPIVYCKGRLVQRGDVFVAVPKEDAAREISPPPESCTAMADCTGSAADRSENESSESDDQETSNGEDATSDEAGRTTSVTRAPTDSDAESPAEDGPTTAVTSAPNDNEGKTVKASDSEAVGDEQTEQIQDTDDTKRNSSTN